MKYFYQVCGTLLVILSALICLFLVIEIYPPDENLLKKVEGPIDKIVYTDNQLIVSVDSLDLTYEKWNGDIKNVFEFLREKANNNVELLVYLDQNESGNIYSIHLEKVPVRTLTSVLEHRESLVESIVVISALLILLGLIGVFFGGRISEMSKSIN
ncbi:MULTISPECIES: hypothetical protein [unclassified Shewanella]|uniref:hypothetical protein n=1 Tax=unclassified Shewanella TaxID=196818 RepID=UPI001C7F6AB7|nr:MULTISPECIES: hypothetical protein [unclassified Shewanella]MCG9732315.1 hypothetical protein [Shewanella sp. Isolate13]